MAEFAGRVALVTGAGSSSGIGFACARQLAAAGATVIISSTTARIRERLQELGSGHDARIADLTKPDKAAALVAMTVKRFGRLDILVNNAGMVQTGRKTRSTRIDKLTDRDWQSHLDLNVTTAFNMIRAALPAMRRKSYGRIVNISSVTGPVVTNPSSGGYASAKAAMTGLTRTVAVENAARGITCNAVLPGWIATASQTKPEAIAGRATPAGRSGTPDEVAACALFLASDAASYVNGAMLVVDGANTLVEFKGRPGDWY